MVFLWAAFSSCYPQTRRHVWGIEQRPHPTKHKDLLFYSSSHCEGFFSPPSFSWSSHKGRVATGVVFTVNQSGVFCGTRTPHTLRSNCCRHQFSCWGVINQPPQMLRFPHLTLGVLPIKPSSVLRVQLQHHLQPTWTTVQTSFHLFLEVQKLFVDTQADRSTPSTSFSSSSLPIQASTLRRFCHATNRAWKKKRLDRGEVCAKGNPLSPDSRVAIFFFFPWHKSSVVAGSCVFAVYCLLSLRML